MEEQEMDYVPQAVHAEFARRIDAEEKRQNERLAALEKSVQEIGKLSLNVERLATNIENMTAEIKEQGERLKDIESKPAKRWDAIIAAVITGAVGILIGLITAGVVH